MYTELIERKILTGVSDEENWFTEQEGILILPESENELEDLVDMLQSHFPDPEHYICDDCKERLEADEKRFDPNMN